MGQRVVVFDLVGTLLDLRGLDPHFRREFGGSRVRQEWFSETLKLALAIAAAGDYEQFSRIAEAALKVVEERHGCGWSMLRRKRILSALRELPAFGDVNPSLRQLRSGGYTLAVLTNSAERSARQALKANNLEDFFEEVLSADRVKSLKPSREPYEMAAKRLGVKPGSILLVAAHTWDIRGAMAAGCRSCFVQRPGQVLDELTPKPDITATSLSDLVAQLIPKQRAA